MISGWITALIGLWEFGDAAAFFTPGFGPVPAFLVSHILAGLVLLVTGIWAAKTRQPASAVRLRWISAAAGAWLVIAAFVLGNSVHPAGRWNDIMAGALALALNIWTGLRSRGIFCE